MNKNRLLTIVLILLTILPAALATTLNEGDSKEVSGKIIKLISVGSDKVVVNVDGVGDIIKLNQIKYVNGVTLTVTGIQYEFDPGFADITITVNQECGDGVCEGDETQATCCKDCGCSESLACTENRCINAEDNECNKNSDCNDNNLNTVDICSGVPRKCSNREVICSQDSECDDKDKDTQDTCVNERCSFVLYSDLAECQKDEDCNDSITCTKDKCQGLPLKCVNEEITSCGSYDDCCPSTCSYPDDLNCKGVRESDDLGELLKDINKEKIVEEENITKEGTETKEKFGFFRRIINWFVKLFTT